MNQPERKIFYLALALFAMGLLYRYLPWEAPAVSQQKDYSNVEYGESRAAESPSGTETLAENTDKVTEPEKELKKGKKSKNKEKRQKKPKLPVHINHADVEEMCALRGVGPKLAEKIVEFRGKNGPFAGPNDLEKVPGIGKKKLEGLLPGVNFD